jgi:hypothetical protein
MKSMWIRFILLALAIGLTFHQRAEAQYSVQKSVFGNGGAVIENGSYRIVGTVGQPVIGMVNGEFKIYSGFWYLPGPPTLIYGDVSGNGSVTAYDASLVLQAVVGLKVLSPVEREAADVTNDGSVTAMDAALILQYTVGLITQFPAEITSVAAPALSAKSEEEALMEKIARLEATELNSEQRKVLEQLKNLVFKRLIPERTVLLQNYPNPFNPETWIPFKLARDADVVINIYEQSGRLIRKIDLGRKEAGYYMEKNTAAYWDGRNDAGESVASGIYFYSIKAGEFTATKKLLILK